MKFLLLLALAFAACTNDSDSENALRSSGYTEIHMTGWSPFVCGQEDTFATGFTAKNSAGSTVSGTVCCGLVTKGCTVRF